MKAKISSITCGLRSSRLRTYLISRLSDKPRRTEPAILHLSYGKPGIELL